MTMPFERTRAVLQTRDFLQWVMSADATAETFTQAKREARTLLRHYTFEDLTTKVLRQVRTRSGTTRQLTYSSEDYWRLNKADIVTAHVEWLKPDAWVAVDDEDFLWPKLWADHVCLVDGLEGLKNPAEKDRLLTYLALNFGQGDQR